MTSMRYPTAGPEEREAAVEAAAAALTRGELVVFPTDTVFGVAADAFSPAAVRRLLQAKGRGPQMPPPVLISSVTTADGLARALSPAARLLMERFWPGPLTLVARQQPSLRWDLGETRGTVALRMPDHEVTLAVLARTGPLAVSSANTTTLPAAESVAEAEGMLGDTVAVYLDGTCAGGEPSTIVDVTVTRPRLLRAGAISVADLDAVLAELDAEPDTDAESDTEPDAGPDTEPDTEPGADTDGGERVPLTVEVSHDED